MVSDEYLSDKDSTETVEDVQDEDTDDSDNSDNPDNKTEDKEIEKIKLAKRLRAVREVIAYKSDEDEYLENMFRDLALNEVLDMEYFHYRFQPLEDLYEHEDRLVRDLAMLNVDASRDSEIPREELGMDGEEMNEEIDLGD